MKDPRIKRNPRIKRVENANHAWLVGQMLGVAMRLEGEVELIDFPDGEHAATFRVRRPSGSYLVTVEVEASTVSCRWRRRQ